MVFIKCDNFTEDICFWTIDGNPIVSDEISKDYKGLEVYPPSTLVVQNIFACVHNTTEYGCHCTGNVSVSTDTDHVYCKGMRSIFFCECMA